MMKAKEKEKEKEKERAEPPDPDPDPDASLSNSKTLPTPAPEAELDLVWVKARRGRGKALQWWPARVLSRSHDNVQLSLFHGHGAASTLSRPASHLLPFFNPNTHSYARRTHPAAFRHALSFATRRLQSQFHHSHIPNSYSNFTPLQFLSCLREAAALSVQAVRFLDSVRLQSWVFALALARNPNPTPPHLLLLHPHDLHSHSDLDDARTPAHLSPLLHNNNTNTARAGRKNNKKRASDADNSFHRETPSPAAPPLLQDEEAAASASAFASASASASAKRERKKSKYLSPPYTDVLPTPIHNQSQHNLHDPPIGETHPDHQGPDYASLFDYQALSVRDIFTDFLFTAMDPFYLKWKRSAKVLRFFFAKFRDAMFVRGREHCSFADHKCDCLMTENVKIEIDLDCNGLGSSFQSCLTPKMDRSNLTTAPDASTVDDECEKERGKEKSDNGALHPKKRGRPRKEDKCLSSLGSTMPIVQKSEQKMEQKGFTSTVSSVSSNDIGGGTVLNFAKGPCEFLGEASLSQMMKASPQQNSYKSAETNKQSQEQSSPKKLKAGNSNNTSGTGPKHDGGQKQNVAQAPFPNPAALLLDFPKPSSANSNGTNLPSRDQLLSTFSKFGLLVDTQSDVDQGTRSACVVFARSADAEAAYNSSDKLGLFGPPFASCRLRYLPPIGANLTPTPSRQLPALQLAAKPQLSDIRKNLEMMISSLTAGSAVHANGESGSALNGIKPELKGSLVEKMQGLLMKVEKRLGDCSASSTATLPGVPPP